nr:uncharacterized protein LOC108060778 [Drosophila takahashii]
MPSAHKDFPVCGNCKKIKNVQNNTGFSCHFKDEKAVEHMFEETANKYPACVPKNFLINRQVLYYCCFWSPELGCSALIGRKLYDRSRDYCDICIPVCAGLKYDDIPEGTNKILEYSYLIALAFINLWI